MTSKIKSIIAILGVADDARENISVDPLSNWSARRDEAVAGIQES